MEKKLQELLVRLDGQLNAMEAGLDCIREDLYYLDCLKEEIQNELAELKAEVKESNRVLDELIKED